MNKDFLMLFAAIIIFMVAFAYDAGEAAMMPDEIRIEYHAVQDGTLVAARTPYKLPEKKQFWTMP